MNNDICKAEITGSTPRVNDKVQPKVSFIKKTWKKIKGWLTKRKETEILMSWELHNIKVTTNVGEQTHSFKCQLTKHYLRRQDITLFERFIVGYKNYFYRVNVTPLDPRGIRENRDKDYLGAFSEEGNDAIREFSLALDRPTRTFEPSLLKSELNKHIIEYLKKLNPAYKIEKYKKIKREKKKWYRRTLIEKYSKNDNNYFSIYTAIYPFVGYDLSGHTTILSFSFIHDGELGMGFELGILGFHICFISHSFHEWFFKKVLKAKVPQFNRVDETWEEYYSKYKQWKKDHKVWNFFHNTFRIDIGVNRANGFYYLPEIDGSTCYGWRNGLKAAHYFNPWRNIFWNLI